MSRTAAASMAAAGLLAVALPSAASAATASASAGGGVGYSAATGGTRFFDPPIITSVACGKGCVVTSADRRKAATVRTVRVRDTGTVVIRGARLSGVTSVRFLGGNGTTDDRAARPARSSARSVLVEVPDSAVSGKIQLVGADGAASDPSRQVVRVLHAADTTGGTQIGAKPDPGATRDPATGSQPAKGSFPWPVIGPITSPYCEQRAWESCHPGIDIGVGSGTPIHVVAAGRVIIASSQGGYGNFTCVAHVTVSTCYAHQSQILVSVGERVSRGEVIGRTGCTGRCYGAHLHFEVRLGTAPWAPVTNPMSWLKPRGRSAHAAGTGSQPPLDWGLPVYGLASPERSSGSAHHAD